MKHVVTTESVEVEVEAVGSQAHVRVREREEDNRDAYACKTVIFVADAAELEGLIGLLANARREVVLHTRRL